MQVHSYMHNISCNAGKLINILFTKVLQMHQLAIQLALMAYSIV